MADEVKKGLTVEEGLRNAGEILLKLADALADGQITLEEVFQLIPNVQNLVKDVQD